VGRYLEKDRMMGKEKLKQTVCEYMKRRITHIGCTHPEAKGANGYNCYLALCPKKARIKKVMNRRKEAGK